MSYSYLVKHIQSIMNKPSGNFYPTWQEAAQAVRSLGIQSTSGYKANRYQDPRLPSDPRIIYKDFPGASIFFLGEEKGHSRRNCNNIYPTWQEAGKAAVILGIRSWTSYSDLYHHDPRLPSNPRSAYIDFPGMQQFLGHTPRPYRRVKDLVDP